MEFLQQFLDKLTPEIVFFYLFAALAVGSALEVVLQRNPLYSAIALIFSFAALAANYVLLRAQFIAAIQIIVYAGAIMVLFVFVIMLLNVRAEESRLDKYSALKFLAVPGIAVLLASMMYTIRSSTMDQVAMSKSAGSVGLVETIGRDLFTVYLLPFEAASVLIMMAIVGAMVLARRSLQTDGGEKNAAPQPAEAVEPTEPTEPDEPLEPEQPEQPEEVEA